MGYALLASLWIAFSDIFAAKIHLPAALFTLKGIAFVGVTALLLYVTMQRLIKAVQSERARWQGVVEGIAEEVWVCDAQGKMTLINLPAVTAMGLETFEHKSVEEVLAEVDILYIDGQPRPAEQAPLLRSLRGEVVRGEEIMRHRRTGSTRYRQFSSAPMRDSTGAITGAVAIVRDITAQKQAEQELQRVNRTLRAINNSNEALLHAADETTLLYDVCRIVTEDCGYKLVWIGYAEDDESQSVRPVAHSGFDEGYINSLQITWADTERGRGPTGRAIRTGQPCICRNMLTDPSFGPWRQEALKRGYASSLVLPLMADAKALGAVNIYSTQTDAFSPDEVALLSELTGDLAYGVTALRTRAAHARANNALRQSEERLAAVIRCAMDAIITIDEQQRIVVFNAAAEKTFGISAAQAIGQPLDRFIPERFREIHRQHVTQFGDTGLTSRSMQSPGTLYGLRADGQEFPIEATISQVEAGGQKLYTVILRDIAQRKQTEEVLMRTEKLTTVGRLAATIAHEINNPLSAVTDMLFLLKSEQSITPASRHYLELAEAELHRAGQIANTALGLSKQAAVPIRFRPAEILDGVLALISRKVDGKGVRIEKTYRAEQLEIIGVAGEIRQVLWNVVSNALDAIPEQGRIVVRVCDSTDWRRPTVRGARFTIADTGCGMRREALQHIFEPFFTTKGTGTGLGLWVTSEIVRKHSGSIKVRSRAGVTQHGTVFSIFIPADGQQIQQISTSPPDSAMQRAV